MAYDGSLIFDTKIDKKGFEKGIDGLKSTGVKAGKLIATGIAAASTAIVAFGGYSIKASIDFESAFAGVKKTIDGTNADFEMLEKGIRDMAKSMPQSASAIAEVAEAAGQLGIKTGNVLSFTETMVMLGDATDMSSDQAATALARLANITGMSQEDFDKLGSSIVGLGNNLATTESEIVDMALRLAGTGSQIGLSEHQILALSGAMSSVGINAESGGSSFSRVMQKINSEVLSGGKKLKDFARISGMSASEFSKSWKEEPEVAIQAFVKGLAKIQEGGGDVTGALKEMGIASTQEIDTLLRLSGAGDLLAESLDLSATAWEENTALVDEANQRYETTESKIAILKNNLDDLAITIGDELNTSLLGVIDTSTEMIDRLASAFEEGGFSGLVEELGSVLADVFTMLAGSTPKMMESATGMIMAFLAGIQGNLPQIIESAMSMMDSFISTAFEIIPMLLELGIELVVGLVNGIAEGLPNLITMGIDLIIGLADTIIDNVPTIIEAGLNLLMGLVKGIMDNLPKLIQEVPRIINSFADAIYSNLPTILKAAIGIMLEIIKGLIQSIPTLVANIPAIIVAIVNAFTLYNWWNLGKSIITKLGTGIKSMVGNIGSIAKNLATNVINSIKGIFTQAPSVGKGFIRGIMNGISSLIGSLLSLGKTMATNALTAIKTAFSKAPSLGSDMVKGIWNGISNVTGWILGKIKGFGSSIVNGIKDIFKIKSPSQVMRDEVGVMLGRGLANGIDKSKKETVSSADKMAKDILGVVKSLNARVEKETGEHNKRLAKYGKIKTDLLHENDKLMLEMSDDFIKEKKKKGEMSLIDEVHYWDQLSKIVHSKSDEYRKALENKQNAINQINNEIIKINEDYSKKMLDIDKKLVEETQKLNEEYAKAYEDRVKELVNVAGLFSEFVEKEQQSGYELINNLQSQVTALEDYGNIIGDLDSRIGNADLMGELRGLGPKAIGELKSLNNMSDEELNEFVALYEERFRLAREQADKELEPLKKDITEQIQELNRASQTELTALQRAWNASIKEVVSGTSKELDSLEQVGKSAIKGLEEGMLSMEDSLMGTVKRIADSIRDTITSVLDINSPSRVMRDEVGLNITRGIGEGLKAGMGDLEKDINSEMSKLTRKMKSTVELETSNNARVMTGSSGYSKGSEVITNNNDNGVVQNVTIVSPKNTPSENARQMRKVGRELSLGY